MSEHPGGPSQHPRQHPPMPEDADEQERMDPGQQFPVENQPAPPEDKAAEQGTRKGKKK